MDTHFIIDGSPISSLPADLINGLKNQGLIEKNNLRFCGIFFSSGINLISFPKNYKPISKSGNFEKQDEILLVKSLYRALEQHKNYSVGFENGEQVLIDCVVSILKDFNRNGLYESFVKNEDLTAGKIDWKRTTQQKQIFFSSNYLPVFKDLFRLKLSSNNINELSLIQSFAIRKICEDFPYFCTLSNADLKLLSSFDHSGLSNNQIILKKLKSIRGSSKDLRAKSLSFLLEAYFSKKYGNFNGILLGIKRFEYLWEIFLKEVICNKINPKFPSLSYQASPNKNVTKPGTSLRPDIITYNSTSNHLSVYDAKYYSGLNIANMPGSSDYIKQNYYTGILTKGYPKASISSAFIFPGSNRYWLNSAFEVDFKIQKNDIFFSKVDCLFVDVGLLMQKYVKSSTSTDFQEILAK